MVYKNVGVHQLMWNRFVEYRKPTNRPKLNDNKIAYLLIICTKHSNLLAYLKSPNGSTLIGNYRKQQQTV